MAGGSQDLVQPNNLALSWCKYTSATPFPYQTTLFLNVKGSLQCCPGPSPSTSLSQQYTHTHTHTN